MGNGHVWMKICFERLERIGGEFRIIFFNRNINFRKNIQKRKHNHSLLLGLATMT